MTTASLVLVVLTGVCVEPAWVQLVSPLKNPRLTLGISAGTRDEDTEVALKLAGPPGMAIGKIEAVITFPDPVLAFGRVYGALITADAVKVETKVQEPKGGKRALVLSVRSSNPDKPLPADALVNLVFKVAKETTPQVLSLALQAKAFALDQKEVAPVDVYGGRINIQDPKIFFGCFFYMH